MTERLSGLARERDKKLIFRSRQLDCGAVFFHGARFRVYDKAARLDHPVLRHIAQRRAHARQKLAYDKRLLQIIIGARIERQDFFRLAVARRYDNDRDWRTDVYKRQLWLRG